MADYFARALQAEDDPVELEAVQDRQPAPSRQPGPTVVPMPSMPQAQPRPRARAPQVIDAEPAPRAEPPPSKSGIDISGRQYLGKSDREKLTPDEDSTYIENRNRWLFENNAPYPSPKPQGGPPAAIQPPGAPTHQPTHPAAPEAPTDYFGRALGRDQQPAPAQAPPPKVVDPNAEPDAPTWIGRRIQDVRGKQDPRYANLPNIARVLQDEGGHQMAPELWSWGVGASDKDMAGVYGPMLGQRFIRQEQDANGYPIVVYKGKDGSERKAYVNNPGLDVQDVARGAYGAIPYVASGAVAGAALKGAPLLGRAGGQALTQGATSLAQDVAGVATGVSELDPKGSAIKAGITAGFGAGGELLGAGVNALMRARAAKALAEGGRLTPEGVAAAREAGVDPSMITGKLADEFAEAFARSGDAAGALKEITSKQWGIPRTVGELSGNRNQLLREQQYRGGTYGETARTRVEQFDKKQGEAITNAVQGEIAPGKPGLYGQVAPARAGENLNKGEIGSNIRANTQAAKDAAETKLEEAWTKVKRIDPTPEALDELPTYLKSGLKDIEIDAATGADSVTPMASKMSKMLDEFKAGKAPAKAAEILPDTTVGDVGMMRKRLLRVYQNAQSDTDIRASKALYDAFNDWIPLAAEKAGDPATAFAMREARGISRAVHEAFTGPQGSPAGRMMQAILKKADSPETIVNELLSAPGKAELKSGSRQAIDMLFKAYDSYLPAEAAKVAKDDIRLAFLHRALNMKTGEVMTPGKMQTALKTMRENQSSLYTRLFDEGERKSMMTLERAMSGIEKKNPNSSWSAIGAGAMMRDIGKALYTMIGGNSVTGKIIGTGLYNRVEKTVGGVGASRATGGGMGAQLPALPAPSYGGIGGAYGSSRTDNR